MTIWRDLREVLTTELRFLSLRPVQPDLDRLGRLYLAMGLVAAWLAGMGRYYDNPKAHWVQSLGLVSVIVVFVLAALLWLLLLPLRPRNWTYRNLLIFVGMTAPPAVLYAAPVHWFFPAEVARSINIWFLVFVASWRVVLLYLHLLRSGRLGPFVSLVALLLPLTLVVTILAALNLQHVTFQIMSGVERMGERGTETIYMVIWALSVFSMGVLPLTLIAYGILVALAIKRARMVGLDEP